MSAQDGYLSFQDALQYSTLSEKCLLTSTQIPVFGGPSPISELPPFAPLKTPSVQSELWLTGFPRPIPRVHGMFWLLTLGWSTGFWKPTDFTQSKLSPVRGKKKSLKNYSNITRLVWVHPALGICFILYIVLVHFAVTLEKYTPWTPSLSRKPTEPASVSPAIVWTIDRLLPARNRGSLSFVQLRCSVFFISCSQLNKWEKREKNNYHKKYIFPSLFSYGRTSINTGIKPKGK